MATITSRLPALIDYLVAQFTAASTLGAATPSVLILDGPAVTLDPAPLALYVGVSDLDSNAIQDAGEITQEWAALGRLGRNETSVIHCVAEAWSGDTNVQVLRQAAAGIVAAVEVLLQNNTTQFGGNVLFPNPGITSGSLSQSNDPSGARARIAFDLTFTSRIGGF